MATKDREPADILAVALQFKKDGQEFFLRCAERVKSPQGKEMFERIAQEESRHLKMITRVYEKMKKDEAWRESLGKTREQLRQKNIFREAIEKGLDRKGNVDANDLQALKEAVEWEEKGRKYFEELSRSTDVPFEKAFFLALAQEEQGHYINFLDAYEYLIDPEDWFAKVERSWFDAG